MASAFNLLVPEEFTNAGGKNKQKLLPGVQGGGFLEKSPPAGGGKKRKN
jgi:hypothetical protein